MISQDEQNYINTIPENKTVVVSPFDKKAFEIADKVVMRVNDKIRNLEVVHMGALALGISGQNDIDIYALAAAESFHLYLNGLVEIFGQPKAKRNDSITWAFTEDSYEIEFYLTDPTSESMKRQIRVFETLKGDDELKKEYERLKEKMNGKSMKEYQRKKYEFYHRILGN